MQENHEVNYINMMGSASHTYGNVLAFIQNWLINIFPENLFKSIHVNSKIGHRQLRSTPHEFLKKTKPMFVIRPRFALDEEQKFLANTPIIKRMNDLYSTHGATNLEPFFFDGEKEIAIKYHLNRYIMYTDVVLVFDTAMECVNYAHYFLEATRVDIPFTLPTFLESFLSEELLTVVSKITGINIYDENGYTKEFIDYMNSHSLYPITYKIQNSTNTKQFYRYYPANIDTLITDFRYDSGEKFGRVTSNYQISFTVRMEFFATGFYYLFSDECKKYKNIPIISQPSALIPVFTDVIAKDDLRLTDGWNHYTDVSLSLEKCNDTYDFGVTLNNSIKRIIKYHRDNGLPLMDVIDLIVRKQGKIMRYGEEYTIDFDTSTINFNVTDFMLYTYHIVICINTKYINEMIKTVFGLD